MIKQDTPIRIAGARTYVIYKVYGRIDRKLIYLRASILRCFTTLLMQSINHDSLWQQFPRQRQSTYKQRFCHQHYHKYLSATVCTSNSLPLGKCQEECERSWYDTGAFIFPIIYVGLSHFITRCSLSSYDIWPYSLMMDPIWYDYISYLPLGIYIDVMLK